MKYLFSILLVSAVCTPFCSLQAQTSSDELYTLYIGTFLNPKITDFDNLQSIGFTYDQPYDESLLKIYMGNYDSKTQAQAALQKVKSRGYTDAYIVSLKEVSQQYVIQLAAERVGHPIDWKSYQGVGDLYAYLQNDQVRIVVGPFAEKATADQLLPAVKRSGRKDAFVRTAPKAALIKISSFETGGVTLTHSAKSRIKKKTEIAKEETVPTEESIAIEETNPEEEEFVLFSYENVQTEKEQPQFLPQERPTTAGARTKGEPQIRSDLKRNSVKELQKLLKANGTYAGGIDGLYGRGTTRAYEDFSSQNRDMRKFQILAEHSDYAPTTTTKATRLESYIQMLPDNPEEAMRGLEVSSEPIAKAYRAYHYFVNNQSNRYVNELMNSAVDEAFVNRRTDGLPFDPSATYAYENLDQLLLHLSYVQKVSDPEPAAPCWLFEKHPVEANKAYAAGRSISPTYAVQECDHFLDWSSLRMLHAIASDLCPNLDAPDVQQSIRKNAIERTRIFLSPGTLAKGDETLIEDWNKQLWSGLEERASKDALYRRWVTPLKATYYQSMVLLEDYFISQGMSKEQARPISIYTLHTIVEPYLPSTLP